MSIYGISKLRIKVAIYFLFYKWYYLLMKHKRILNIICLVLIVTLMSVTLSACLKIGMGKNKIIDRLNKAEVSISYDRTSPMTEGGQNSHKIGDIVHGTKSFAKNEDGEEIQVTEHLYVFFAGDIRSADWIEEACKTYVNDNADSLDKWNVYRFDEVVAVGYYRLVNIVRQY